MLLVTAASRRDGHDRGRRDAAPIRLDVGTSEADRERRAADRHRCVALRLRAAPRGRGRATKKNGGARPAVRSECVTKWCRCAIAAARRR